MITFLLLVWLGVPLLALVAIAHQTTLRYPLC
jgi:hypothetical protein